jgi:DNA excision repair protein ERCC-4
MAAGSAMLEDFHLVLEEQPKWKLLAEILEEIEQDSYFNPVRDDSSGTILVMCSDKNTCRQLRDYLNQIDRKKDSRHDSPDAPSEKISVYSAEYMMRRKFKEYLEWKAQFARVSAKLFEENQKALEIYATVKSGPLNRGKGPPNKRRRVRGGSTVASGPGRSGNAAVDIEIGSESQPISLLNGLQLGEQDQAQQLDDYADNFEDAENYFEMFEPNDMVLILPYDGDMDEQLLEEVQPRYVIMYEPDAAFIRRVEVYRSSHTARNVRVYFTYYAGSVEEQRYLSAVRKEKDAFTKLIKERAVGEILRS